MAPFVEFNENAALDSILWDSVKSPQFSATAKYNNDSWLTSCEVAFF